MRDLFNNINPKTAAVVTVSDNTAVVSPVADTLGYGSLTFLIGTGTLADADATFTVLMEESDSSDMSGATNVADADLLGTEALASFTFATDGVCRKVGYIGAKRYVRCTITPANNTGSAPIAIIPLIGHPRQVPTANPPA